MEQEQELTPFEDFSTKLTALVREYTQTVAANDMIKAFRHIEVDLLAALMISIRVADRSTFVRESSEEQT